MTFDVHAHYLSPAALAEAERSGESLHVRYSSSDKRLAFPWGKSRPVPVDLIHLDGRRAWNRSRNLDIQILSPWMDVVGDELDADESATWTRILNDSTAADIAGAADFRAFAALPIASPTLAAEELRRCVEELGFVGAILPTQGAGRNLDEIGLDAVFEAAEALDVPLFLHPFRVLGPERMQMGFLANSCGNPFETTVAAAVLFLSDVFERFPALKVLLSHGGGTLPFIAGRIALGSAAPRVVGEAITAGDLLSAYFYDTVVHDAAALGFMIQKVSAHRCALGTDAPFPMRVDDPLGHLENSLSAAGLESGTLGVVTDVVPRKLLPSS